MGISDCPSNVVNTDSQTLSIDEECNLAISGGNSVALPGFTKVYRLEPAVTGVRNREWHDTAPVVPISASTTEAGRNFRLSHDFSLPTTTDTVITNLNLNDTDNTAQELDVQVLDTVITVPAGGIWVRYTGGSEGYWAIEVGLCCGPLELRDELGYTDREDNTAVVGPVFLPEGQHQFRAWNIDSGGTNSSHTVSYSTDGTTFANALPAGVSLTLEKRKVQCQPIGFCEDVPEGWQSCPIQPCAAGVVDPKPIELEAEEPEPVAPADIDVVYSGSGTLASNIILDRWEEGNAFSFETRSQISAVAGNGWDILTFPGIAGYKQPQLFPIGTYRTTSASPQKDDNGTGVRDGAMPNGPIMTNEAAHWSSTRRIYSGAFRKESNYSVYVGVISRYVRV